MRAIGKSFVFLFAVSLVTSIHAEVEGQPVRIAKVENRPIARQVSTYGVLAPKIEDLSFRINGRIASFNVSEGQRVEENQVLAELEKRDAEDQLNKAKVDRDQAARQYERFETLAEQRMIQASQLENARDALKSANINFEQAKLTLQRCTLRSPAAGIILREYLDSRTTITAGTPIYSFRDVSKSWVTEVELTDRNAFVFGLGTTAIARFAPYPGETFPGELTKQAGVADENDGLYTVEITIQAEGRELRPGMVVEVDLFHETEAAYSMVPLDALIDVRGNQGVIYLLDTEGKKAQEVPVHIAAIAGGMAALAEPLQAGASVVVRGQQSLRHNAAVRVL
jgi:membrane fusion protein (multidrug efflux system)